MWKDDTVKRSVKLLLSRGLLNVYMCTCMEDISLITDCEPVELILNNRQSRPPARIERWDLRLQDYDFDVSYTKGHDNPSDFLSRHLPINDTSGDKQFQHIAEKYVCFLTQHAVIKQ